MIDVDPKFYSAPPSTHDLDLQVKLTDFDFFCSSFLLKVLRSLYNLMCFPVGSMLGTMTDIGPKFYSNAPPVCSLQVKVTDFDIWLSVLFKLLRFCINQTFCSVKLMCARYYFLAYQIRISACFTCAYKSYLTHVISPGAG